MKKQKGIALVTLVVTVIILMLILGVVVHISTNNLKVKNLNNLYTDLRSLNDHVATYYNKYGALPLGAKYTGEITFDEIKNVNDDPNGYYVLDIEKLSNLLLTRNLSWNGQDVYIINTATHSIYYPKGVVYENAIYYALPMLSGGKIIFETPTPTPVRTPKPSPTPNSQYTQNLVLSIEDVVRRRICNWRHNGV